MILIPFILILHCVTEKRLGFGSDFKNNPQPYSGISYHPGNCLKCSLYDTKWKFNFLKFPINGSRKKRLGDRCAHVLHPHSRTLDQVPHIVDVSTSASFSEASIELKPKPFDFKSNRDILPEKTGSRLTRYLQCKSSHGSRF